MSPKSPRSTSKLERQISQPTSPAVAEISLKVASIRQNITDIKEEIVKKKTNGILHVYNVGLQIVRTLNIVDFKSTQYRNSI